MGLVKFESGIEVSAVCRLPSWPVLASEVASRRAARPSTTSSGRTSAPTSAVVTTTAVRGCCIPASSSNPTSIGASEGASAALLRARVVLRLLSLLMLRSDRSGGVAGLAPFPLPDHTGLLADLAGRRHFFQAPSWRECGHSDGPDQTPTRP
jgi:hypothetical protein